MNTVIQLVAAMLGSFGFAMIFNAKLKYAVIGSFGGFFAWGIYLFAESYFSRVFFICLFASFFAALFSEVCARFFKAPATIFFIIAIIPLVPGNALYQTISNVVSSNWDKAEHFAFLTFEYAFSIAIGGCFVWSAQQIINNIIKKHKKTG